VSFESGSVPARVCRARRVVLVSRAVARHTTAAVITVGVAILISVFAGRPCWPSALPASSAPLLTQGTIKARHD